MILDKASITIRVPLPVRDDILAVAISRGLSLSRQASELVEIGLKEAITQQSASDSGNVEVVRVALRKIFSQETGNHTGTSDSDPKARDERLEVGV